MILHKVWNKKEMVKTGNKVLAVIENTALTRAYVEEMAKDIKVIREIFEKMLRLMQKLDKRGAKVRLL